jgi:endonuclease/exonuclease/phosphatase family metal-dependent hydrolase
LQPEIDRVLNNTRVGDFAPAGSVVRNSIRALAWNIERGICTEGIIHAIQNRKEIESSDVLMLSELDQGMARTRNRFVVRDIAEALHLNYAFAPCYLALNKGNGTEKNAEGENRESLHGNALLSPHPLRNAHSLPLPNGKDKMKGDEKRIGCQRAVIADVVHPRGTFRAVEVHLDAHSSQRHRHLQMKLVLDHLDRLQPQLPVLIGGDWNTTTHDASRALYSILGYWRRVFMGVRNVIANHYPYPERWFERRLFGELDRRGYAYRELNAPGACTLHYTIEDMAANLNMREWVPGWCFWFINWALERTGGRCSLKLDWFAGKGIRVDPVDGPRVVGSILDQGRRVSDHDPIVVGFNFG